MRKRMDFILMMLLIGFAALAVGFSNARADAVIPSSDLTIWNGALCYWTETDFPNIAITARNADTGEESPIFEGSLRDREGNYLSINGLTSDSQGLIGIDSEWREVYRIDASGAKTLFFYDGDTNYRSADLAVCGSYLFARWDQTAELARYDMRDGTGRGLPIEHAVAIFSMRDGTLLVHQRVSATEPERLLVVDPETCEILSVIATFEGNPYPTVAVDAANDRVYAAFSAAIWRWEQNQWVKLRNAQLPMKFGSPTKARCAGNWFCFKYEEQWQTLRLDEDVELLRVSVGGGVTQEDESGAYMLEHPDRLIVKENSMRFLTAEDLYIKLLTKDDNWDIYIVLFSEKLVELAREGVFPALRGKAFETYRNNLYTPLADAVTADGALFAVYDSLSIDQLYGGLNEDTPKTMNEMIDLMTHWDQHPANQGQPVFTRYEHTVDAYDLLNVCLRQLIYQQARGCPLWDSADMRVLLKKIRDAKLPAKRKTDIVGDQGSFLSVSTGSCPILWSPEGLQPPLELVDGVTMLVPNEGGFVYVLNPYAKHPNEAADYLAYLCQHASLTMQFAAFSNVKSEMREDVWQRIEAKEKELAQAVSKDQKIMLHAEIEQIRSDPYSYTASPETLAMYREKIIPRLVPVMPELLAYRSAISIRSFIEEQANRYLNRQITTEQLIGGIRRKVEMSAQED